MPRYMVIGPERGVVIPVTDFGEGPTEYGCDVYLVDAPNRREARWAAFREAKRTNAHWWRDLCDDHPMRGVKVEAADDVTLDDWGPTYYIDASSVAL